MMMETLTGTFTLNSPLTEEDWDKITDVDFDNTHAVTFHTKHGKEVEFLKVARCKDCTEYQEKFRWCSLHDGEMQSEDYCSYGERKPDETD